MIKLIILIFLIFSCLDHANMDPTCGSAVECYLETIKMLKQERDLLKISNEELVNNLKKYNEDLVNNLKKYNQELLSKLNLAIEEQNKLKASYNNLIYPIENSINNLSKYYPIARLEHEYVSRFTKICTLKNGDIVTNTENGILRVWNGYNFKLITTPSIKSAWALTGLESGYLATAFDKNIFIVDTKTYNFNTIYNLTGHTRMIWKLFELPNGNLVSTSDDSSMRVWNPKKNFSIEKVFNEQGSIRRFSLFPNGNLVTGHSTIDNFLIPYVKIWNSESLEIIHTIKLGPTGCEVSVAALPNAHVAVFCNNSKIDIYDGNKNFILVHSIPVDSEHQIYSMDVSARGHLISSGNDGKIHVYNPEENYKVVKSIRISSWISEIKVLSNTLLAVMSADGMVTLWNI